jgi:hypothetical protein
MEKQKKQSSEKNQSESWLTPKKAAEKLGIQYREEFDFSKKKVNQSSSTKK